MSYGGWQHHTKRCEWGKFAAIGWFSASHAADSQPDSQHQNRPEQSQRQGWGTARCCSTTCGRDGQSGQNGCRKAWDYHTGRGYYFICKDTIILGHTLITRITQSQIKVSGTSVFRTNLKLPGIDMFLTLRDQIYALSLSSSSSSDVLSFHSCIHHVHIQIVWKII